MLQPSKLPSNHMLLIFWHSHCAVCAATVHQSLVESILENGWSRTEACWVFLHVNCRQLSKFFLQCFDHVVIGGHSSRIPALRLKNCGTLHGHL
ncbi:putative signal peptide protein [Puccinia sorghi]|uniref:Putative signal peptide protein n=1 Tax=Puccinia sorghi TaxID=27349 RepID=A0A0L6VCQ0_9BASI|nr:putative signal peptide protein [Puccinia sorghi]